MSRAFAFALHCSAVCRWFPSCCCGCTRPCRHPSLLLSAHTSSEPNLPLPVSSFRLVRNTAQGFDVAVKRIHKSRLKRTSNRKLLESEIAILQELKHPNVVALYEHIQLDNYICLVMEYCNGGDLNECVEIVYCWHPPQDQSRWGCPPPAVSRQALHLAPWYRPNTMRSLPDAEPLALLRWLVLSRCVCVRAFVGTLPSMLRCPSAG